ncbi:helix-turn-helix domain-containing protein [Clavibacter zhangzhiyongii]|uniref:helix-turn-helix domain-containing protein n=1 Tax=Clavibacter zhangzhiyongii TaxID=2768071 RepID=UPI0039DFB9BA
MVNSNDVIHLSLNGERVRFLRLALGLTQADLAAQAGIASGTVSMIENGHQDVDSRVTDALAKALDCLPSYLTTTTQLVQLERPKLRAYADAPQRAVDQTLYDSLTAVAAIKAIGLRALPQKLPIYAGDLNDDEGIDRVAADARSAANLPPETVIGNVIRAAETLGCVVLPLDAELGRHWGMSVMIDGTPVIRVTRPSRNSEADIPGDRQRFTVAHELGHLILHAGSPQPSSPAEASRLEREANRFAAAFLVPGDAALRDLAVNGGRVTLNTLALLKQKWGYSIKAFVFRFRELGVIDEAQARSLYKQISARRWNKDEPYRPGTEVAVWLSKALQEKFPGNGGASQAAREAGLGKGYLLRWLDWSASGSKK